MKEVKIYNFKSERKHTPFAFEWDYKIIEGEIEDVDFGHIASYLLKKQDEILQLDPLNDGGTSLGMNTTTARHHTYNVFNFEDTEIKKLKANIKALHDVFLRSLGKPDPINLFTQCWYNVMNKGQKISTHFHDIEHTGYLGGHITVQCDDTYTGYTHPALTSLIKPNAINDWFVHKSKNKVGKITLFPNYIPHFTNVHQGNEKRITIAFDLTPIKYTPNFVEL